MLLSLTNLSDILQRHLRNTSH